MVKADRNRLLGLEWVPVLHSLSKQQLLEQDLNEVEMLKQKFKKSFAPLVFSTTDAISDFRVAKRFQ